MRSDSPLSPASGHHERLKAGEFNVFYVDPSPGESYSAESLALATADGFVRRPARRPPGFIVLNRNQFLVRGIAARAATAATEVRDVLRQALAHEPIHLLLMAGEPRPRLREPPVVRRGHC